jgi:hypothetical protein
MRVLIDREAISLLFRVILSCQDSACTGDERALFDLVVATPLNECVDVDAMHDVLPRGVYSSIKRLCDFATWGMPDQGEPFFLRRRHVLQYFASPLHWRALGHDSAHALDGAAIPPAWFVGHMLLPVRVTEVGADSLGALYEYRGGNVRMASLLATSGYEPKIGDTWAVHFAVPVCRITPDEESMLRLIGELDTTFVAFRDALAEIDYADFEPHGDYRAMCGERFGAYYV